ncbi:MAG: uncharacterized protein A8A55_1789 [Amphiamblys sp. WSBS2006]|nr:MAG: uncharacterized protein A8A55_1789 [Amphiamblys sp. WSBS2006]
MNLKNTHIEELVMVDETALEFFYGSIERSELSVEKVSFGSKLNKKSEKIFKLLERVHEGETTVPKKIKKLALNKNSFFCFLEEARKITKKKIHVEDLAVTQKVKDTGPETNTRIVVSKRISIRGNAHVLQFIEFGPEINRFNIVEIQRQCHFPWIDIPRINIRLTENKTIVRGKMHVLQFLKKNIAVPEACFFADKRKTTIEKNKMALAVGGMESISFGGKGLFALSSITNEKIDVRNMAVMDTIYCFSKEEKEETKKKEFMIREELYMRNTEIFFLEFLGNTVFIPVIKIEVNRCMEHWGGFEETTSIHIETNAFVEKINQEIENTGEIKQKIGEMMIQKETVVKTEFGYQKLVLKEYSKHEEQGEPEESEDQPITEYQELEEFKEYCRYEEQRGRGESSEQPITGCQVFGAFKKDYSLLEEPLDMHIPEEYWFFQDKEVTDTCWKKKTKDAPSYV